MPQVGVMSRVRRLDYSSLGAPTRRADGSLVADANLTRTGVFTYRNADGSERREYRPPSSVFNADSLASFKLVPITDDHPPEMLNAKNARKYAVGTVGESIRKDGDHIAATIVVHDADTIAKMDAGKRAVSCGYDCDLDETAGTSPDGERYDAVQTNIVGNHLAIVHNARAGHAAAVRMDAAAWVEEDPQFRSDRLDHEENTIMDELKKALADAATQKARADAAEKTAAEHKSALDKATARVDSLTEELAAAQKARTDALAATPALVRARVELETKAASVMAKEFKMDGLDDRAIRVAVIKHVSNVDLGADKSDDYITARFDAAIERASTSSEVFQRANGIIQANGAAKQDAGDAAKAEYLKKQKDLFIPPGGRAAAAK